MEKSSNKQRSYRFKKKLGEGTYGTANLMEDQINKTLCVIKAINIENIPEDELKNVQKEAKIIEKLDHPNIVKFLDLFMMKKPKLTLNIVMEYADGGDLKNKIKEYKEKGKYFTENRILDYFTQICLAIKHIHDRKILHRDIKSANIFLTSNDLVKLGDFGVSKILDATLDKASTFTGTPYYLSPEIIENTPYSFKSDIWALGVLLYELCTLKVPFEADNLALLAIKIQQGVYKDIPKNYSKELRELVSLLLKTDQNKRPNIKEILKMKVIKDKIKFFLNEQQFNSEFSHTIIHNYKILEDKVPPLNIKTNLNKEDSRIVKDSSGYINEVKTRKRSENVYRRESKDKRKDSVDSCNQDENKLRVRKESAEDYKVSISPSELKKEEKVASKFKKNNEIKDKVNVHKMMEIMNKVVMDQESDDEYADLGPTNSGVIDFEDIEDIQSRKRSQNLEDENEKNNQITEDINEILVRIVRKFIDDKGIFDKVKASNEIVKSLTEMNIESNVISLAVGKINEIYGSIVK